MTADLDARGAKEFSIGSRLLRRRGTQTQRARGPLNLCLAFLSPCGESDVVIISCTAFGFVARDLCCALCPSCPRSRLLSWTGKPICLPADYNDSAADLVIYRIHPSTKSPAWSQVRRQAADIPKGITIDSVKLHRSLLVTPCRDIELTFPWYDRMPSLPSRAV